MRPAFNTAGPCFPDEHYMVPPERRLGPALELIEEGKFFTFTGGRQTGKTTSLLWLVQHLDGRGHLRAIWVDLQTAREKPSPAEAFPVVLEAIAGAAELQLPDVLRPSEAQVRRWLETPDTAVRNMLRALAAATPVPLVVLFDEVDGLVGAAMVSFLTQLRDGYIARKNKPFPRSIALVGMRHVRDYVISADERKTLTWLGTTSPFNITAAGLTLAVFTRADVDDLLDQHTRATGQVFQPDARDRLFDLSEGHPWLTNAIADQIVARDARDRSTPITAAHVEAAKDTIILERRTHIDSLIARLRDPRVRKILDPMIAGQRLPAGVLDDDFAYVVGLGLIRNIGGEWRIANGVYREVIPRALSYMQQLGIHESPGRFVGANGSLDMPKLMAEWQRFWRIDGHLAAEGFDYRESGPHLMLMAFLQRILNGGGRIAREYGIGRRALDLLIEWKGERHAIDVKLRRDTETRQDALEQVGRYLDGLGLTEGWLVLFDLRSTKPWPERIWNEDVTAGGKTIHIVGC